MVRICQRLALIALALHSLHAAEGSTLLDGIQSTYKLYNEASTGTGFVVRTTSPAADRKADYVIVTAAHVFEGMRGDSFVLVLRDQQSDGSYRRHDLPVPIRKDGKNLWTRHDEMDLAILPYVPAPSSEPFAIPLEHVATQAELASRVAPAANVRVLCFPERFEANASGFPIMRVGALASYPLAPMSAYKTFMIDYTAFAGDSGGPVFGELDAGGGTPGASLKVLGVVVERHFHDERIRVAELEDRIVRHPYGLGTAINAQALRDLIERRTSRSAN